MEGKLKKKRRHRRKAKQGKILAITLTMVLVLGLAIGGTIAWLTADSDTVTNTFTESDIDITLTETGITEQDRENEYKMVPGWAIDKDPKVTVDNDSEDCWLFVKITESTAPDLDAYIVYEIADKYDETTNPDGWQIVQEENAAGEIVIGRKVYKEDTTKEFGILGAGFYTDPMDPDKDDDSWTISWQPDQVGVKPSVTKQMMTAISTAKPTLSFQAYAVQLFKTNSDEFTAEFTADEAWTRVTGMSSGN